MANQWTFLSNHSHVLVAIARDPQARVRDIAVRVGITERAVLRILGELKDAGFLACERIGRRNQYSIFLDGELRHELEAGVPISRILEQFVSTDELDEVAQPSCRAANRNRRRFG